MMLVDTNVLIDVLEDDPDWAEWSVTQLRAQSQIHELMINPVIYAELSLAFKTWEELDETVAQLRLVVQDLPRAALFLAGKAFIRYRSVGGAKFNVLPDFFIGAHAAVQSASILTRDASRYKSYFPHVHLVTPYSN